MENIATTGVLNHPQVLGSALSYLDRGMGPKLLQQVIEHCNAPAAPRHVAQMSFMQRLYVLIF